MANARIRRPDARAWLAAMRRSAATGITRMALAAAAVGLPPAVANAQVIPPVEISLSPRICPGPPEQLSCDVDTPDVKYHVDGTVVLAPIPSVVSNATVDRGPPDFGLISSANLTYSFAIVGPPGLPVPVLISAAGTVDATGEAWAYALWRSAGTPVQAACVPPGNPACGTTTAPSFGGTTKFFFEIGTVQTISLSTEASASTPSGSASAHVDPTIQIDPSFANASQYQLVLSDGVGNAPEPSALESSSCALLGLTALLRTRASRKS